MGKKFCAVEPCTFDFVACSDKFLDDFVVAGVSAPQKMRRSTHVEGRVYPSLRQKDIEHKRNGDVKLNGPVPSKAVADEVSAGGFTPALCRAHAREVRDELQRLAAQKRRLEAYKAKPKRERLREIQEKRDKRNPVKFQSGRVVLAAAGASLFLLGTAFNKMVRSLRGTGAKVVQAANMISEKLAEVARALKKSVGKVLWAVPFVMAVFFLFRKYAIEKGPLVTLVVAALAALVGPKLWSVVSEFFPDGSLTFQSGVFDNMSKLLATLFTFSVFKKKVSPTTMTEFTKRISMLDRMKGGWESFIKWVLEAVEHLINFVRKRFGKSKIQLFKRMEGPINKWADSIDRLSSELVDANPTTEQLDQMVNAIREGYTFKELYRNTSMGPAVDSYIIKAVNLLQPYVGALNARNNFRFEPAAAMFLGRPGIGKTLMAMPLCAAVMMISGLLPPGSTSEDVAKNVWQKGTSEYWNGYANQLSLVMDDAFQAKADVSDKENDFMNIIRMIGTWSFPLNFADLASKGRVYFGSKFVFGTTNCESIKAEADKVLIEPGAVVRRINFPYRLRVKSEYMKEGKLDYEAYQRELCRSRETNKGIDAFPWYIWEAAKHDYLTGRSSTEWLPLREVVMMIATDIKRRTETHTEMKEFLADFVSGFVEEQAGREIDSELFDEYVDCTVPTNKDEFEQVYLKFVQEESSLSNTLMHVLKGVLIGWAVGMALHIVLFGLMALFQSLFGKKQKKAVEPIEDVIDEQSNRPVKVKHSVQKKDLRLQSVDSNVATNVYANSYKLYVETMCGSELVLGQVVFLVGELAMQPLHFTRNLRQKLQDGEISNDCKIVLRNAMNEEHNLHMTVSKFLSLKRVEKKDNDLEFLHFGVVRAHRNVMRNFMKEVDVKHLGGVRCRLDVCEIDDRKRVLDNNTRLVYTSVMQYGQDLRIAGKRIERYFTYSAATSAGDCGAPLCVLDNSSYSGRTAVGMHVAGASMRQTGYATIVTQEMIEEARKSLCVVDDKFADDLVERGVEFQVGNELPFEKKGSFLAIGEATPVTICPRTSFYPTRFYGRFGDYPHLPAPMSPVLRDGKWVYPMSNAVANYASPLLIYEQPWLKHAVHTSMRPFIGLTKGYSRRIYTFEEAVKGVPQEKFRSIPRGTAAGYPYNLEVKDGKKEFFGVGDEYDLTTDKAVELFKRVEHVISQAKQGVRLSHVFVDFLKDELRTPQKVHDVATRLISSAPLDYTIAWRMYFGAFSAAFMRVHTLSGMCPGICAYTDWPLLVQQLRKKGPHVFDGDLKWFDATEQPSVHEEILNFVNEWYDDGPENALVRRVLWLDLVHSRHIGGLGFSQKYIYQWNKSLPSGHPFTTIVNSMYCLFLLVSAYIDITNELTTYWTYVSPATYGDDNVSNVHESRIEQYNQKTVSESLKKMFNVVYTPGKKDQDFQTVFPLEEATFLKRGFVCRDNDWLCPLEKESFLFVVYWSKNRRTEDKMLVDALETALEELCMHDTATWDEYAPMIAEAMEQMGHVSTAPIDKTQYLQLVRSRTDNWY